MNDWPNCARNSLGAQAAHLSARWATHVLEPLSTRGKPTRAEITDAAMGVRAECTVLNKGAPVLVAMETLDPLLRHAHR